MKKTLLILFLCFFCSGMLSASNMNDYRGNKNSKVYHYQTCKFFNRLTNYEEFTTAQEAENKGYSPCKICHPDRIANNRENILSKDKIMLANKENRNATQ